MKNDRTQKNDSQRGEEKDKAESWKHETQTKPKTRRIPYSFAIIKK